MTDQWAVLRMAGRNTLHLAGTLTTTGFDVWTPTEQVTKRVPRANVKRRLTIALLPSYLFARADRLGELVGLANMPVKDHRDFSVMIRDNHVPLIADVALEPLRTAERKRTPLERGLTPGEKVRLTEGGFAGLNGIVETARGQFAMVAIPGFRMPLKIATWHLLREERKAA